MSSKLYQLFEDKLASHQKVDIEVAYVITGAKTGRFILPAPLAIVGYDTGDFSQAAIDALLGTTNEFIAATAFGATAMGTDALGLVLGLAGQAAVTAECFMHMSANIGGTAVAVPVVKGQVSALPNTLATSPRMQVGANGNLAIQAVITGLDAATSGMVTFRLSIQPK
jgi:hypothetical protein